MRQRGKRGLPVLWHGVGRGDLGCEMGKLGQVCLGDGLCTCVRMIEFGAFDFGAILAAGVDCRVDMVNFFFQDNQKNKK